MTGKLTPGLTTHQELVTSGDQGGTRPSSRQRRQAKREGREGGSKTLSHISGSSDQLLPTFYENVSSIQNRQKMLGKAGISDLSGEIAIINLHLKRNNKKKRAFISILTFHNRIELYSILEAIQKVLI